MAEAGQNFRYQFGIGGIFGRPAGGNLATPSYPQFFGVIQDASVDFSGKNEALRGENQWPEDVAASDKELKGKAAFARLDVNVYNALFFGDTVSTGGDDVAYLEPHPVPSPSGPYTVTVTNSGQWTEDLGVLYADTRKALIAVAGGAEALGKYSVSAGVYTFDATDAGNALLFNYAYTVSTGVNLVVNNHLQGYGPIFELWLRMPYQGKQSLRLFSCRANKMSAPLKRAGYVISDFEFEAFADSQGRIFKWTQA